MPKNNDGDVDGAEDGEFMSFLEETALSFQERPRKRASQSTDDMKRSQDVSRIDRTYTERLRSSLIALISIFLRPIAELIDEEM